jgi:hypothetical protein
MQWVLTFFTENPWVALVLLGIIIGLILKK